MNISEYVDKVFEGCKADSNGRISTSLLLPVFNETIKAVGGDKTVTQEDVDKGLAQIQLSEPNTITKDEFLQLLQLAGK